MITRRDIVVASLAIAATAAIAAVAQTSVKPLMRSSVFNWSSLKVAATKTGERRDIFDTATATVDRLECHVTTINAGESAHAAHRHPEEEILFVMEGTLEIMQNDRTNRVEAGGVVFEASNELHGARNIGTNRATYYVLKWYPAGLAKAKSQ